MKISTFDILFIVAMILIIATFAVNAINLRNERIEKDSLKKFKDSVISYNAKPKPKNCTPPEDLYVPNLDQYIDSVDYNNHLDTVYVNGKVLSRRNGCYIVYIATKVSPFIIEDWGSIEMATTEIRIDTLGIDGRFKVGKIKSTK